LGWLSDLRSDMPFVRLFPSDIVTLVALLALLALLALHVGQHLPTHPRAPGGLLAPGS
jgi:hypothetical protein